MKSTNILTSIFKRFRLPIAVTFGLLSLENVVSVLTPLLLGLAIDGLLAGSWQPALVLAGVLAAGTLIGTVRRLYDTRCYGRIYATLATENAAAGWKAGLPLSALSARTDQIWEMVDFVETELVMSFSSAVKVFGALIMLAIVDVRLIGAALLTALAVIIVYALSGHRIYRMNRGLNDRFDQQVNRLGERDPRRVKSHFATVVRWRIRLSDMEARNFAIIDMALIGLVAAALWIAATGANPTPGSVFAILAYILEFIEGSYMLPLAFQQFVRLREIASRLSLAPETLEKRP